MTSPGSKRNFKAEVTQNVEVSKGHFLMGFEPFGNPPEPMPGQFYMVGTGESNDPLLKRPFCFFRKYRKAIQILYRVRGKGTALLSRMKPGVTLNVVGPLGNSWPMPEEGRRPLIIAGGIGIASVFPLAASLAKKPIIVYGGKNRDELVMLDDLKLAYAGLHPATEDGSYGTRGTVMDLLKSLDIDDRHLLYACGPRGMLKAVAEFALERGLEGYASLEEKMACGMGACLGCAVKTAGGVKEVCVDGPVFRLDEVIWEE